MRLTPTGHEVLTTATEVHDALDLLGRRLAEARREPAGLLRVATTVDLGPLLVAPVAARLIAMWPKVRVEVVSDDAAHDLLEAQVDLAVRLGGPRSSSYIVRRLSTQEEPIVASPVLAESMGAVVRPRDLAEAPWVRHTRLPPGPLRFTGPDGAVDEVTPSVRAEANTGATVLAFVLAGAGLGVYPRHGLWPHLDAGRLVVVCPGWIWKTVSLHALLPSRPTSNPTVEAFLDLLKDEVSRAEARWRSSL
jgi:DNA-binding transcriptional LysR family regulator